MPQTLRVGGAILVAVFAHAALYEAFNGTFPAAQLVYAAAALFVTVRGGAWRARSIEPRAVQEAARSSRMHARKGDGVDEKSLFTRFWVDESKTTRKVLGRIPEGSDYRPDPKSRTAQEIAWQIVCEERMIIEAIESGKAEWAPPPMPATMMEVLEAYDKLSAAMPERWAGIPAARWEGALDFFGSEHAAAPMAWSFLFDIVHHRGQITTYLRPMGSTVPQVYGPSADEP